MSTITYVLALSRILFKDATRECHWQKHLAAEMGTLNYFYWSYENRVGKHFVIFLNFPCLIAFLLCCLLMWFVLLVLWLGICVEVDVGRITVFPPLPPSQFLFVPIHNSLFNTSDSYLKPVRALEKFPGEHHVKLWDGTKLIAIRRVCIVQYRIIFSFHLAKPDQSLWSGLRQKGTILVAFLRRQLSLWPREQALRRRMN